MKQEGAEILRLFREKNWSGLLYRPTDNGLLQFLRYTIVGASAFAADFLTVFLATELGLHYLVAAIAGFVVGVVVNYYLSKHLAFSGQHAPMSEQAEFLVFVLISLIGLGLTELLMWTLTEGLGLHYLLSKIGAAAVVLLWNFFSKKLLYRKRPRAK